MPPVAWAIEAAEIIPPDARLGPLKDLDGDFPMAVPSSVDAWAQRADAIRRQMELALGLFPRPERPVLCPVVTGRVERDEYVIENVYIETSPGLYLTGNLYTPKPAAPGYAPALRAVARTPIDADDSGDADDDDESTATTGALRPVVLSPHGHGENGRFEDHGEAGIAKRIAAGAERFPIGGRYPEQARSVGLVRMGMIVFEYDMLGYADGHPLTYDVIHRFAKQTPAINAPDSWQLFSAQAEMRLVSAMALQTWNSLCALDYVLSLPEADPTRVGVTGASGGGTQTMILTALDERVTASAPVVMVSTAMQGGCTCENACYLRIGTGNVEFAGLACPRPLAMVAADDWTAELESKGLPELKALYALHGHADRVRGRYFPFPHNYNQVSRQYVYSFFHDVFDLKSPVPIEERDFVPLSRDDGSVWTEEHPRPLSSPEREHQIAKAWATHTARGVPTLDDRSATSSERAAPSDAWDQITGTAWRHLLGGLPPAGTSPELPSLVWQPLGPPMPIEDGATLFRGVLRDPADGRALPVVEVIPAGSSPGAEGSRDDRKPGATSEVVFWVSEAGLDGLMATDGTLRPEVSRIVASGRSVVATDWLLAGRFVTESKRGPAAWDVPNPREAACYTLGYNRPLLAERSRDVATVAIWLADGFSASSPESNDPSSAAEGAETGAAASGPPKTRRLVHLIAPDAGGLVAAGAALLTGDRLASVALDTSGFRFETLTDITEARFLPGAIKYGDLPTLLACLSPRVRLRVAGEAEPVGCGARLAAWRGSQGGRTVVIAGDLFGGPKTSTPREAMMAWLDDPTR